LSCESEFEGRWKENKKHGQGIKKLKTGRMEEQVYACFDCFRVDSLYTLGVEFKVLFWTEQNKGTDSIAES